MLRDGTDLDFVEELLEEGLVRGLRVGVEDALGLVQPEEQLVHLRRELGRRRNVLVEPKPGHYKQGNR